MNQSTDYAITGTYICAADDSVWAFGGDILAVAFNDEEAALDCYVCKLGFYQTVAENDEDSQLCVVIYNATGEEISYWYLSNLVDEEGTYIGLYLSLPGDDSSFIQLIEESVYDEVVESVTGASGDAAADDVDAAEDADAE